MSAHILGAAKAIFAPTRAPSRYLWVETLTGALTNVKEGGDPQDASNDCFADFMPEAGFGQVLGGAGGSQTQPGTPTGQGGLGDLLGGVLGGLLGGGKR